MQKSGVNAAVVLAPKAVLKAQDTAEVVPASVKKKTE